MKTNGTTMNPDAYAAWLVPRIGWEVMRLRESCGLSAYALARLARVSDQTILNLEQGHCDQGCLTGTLARICACLGTTVFELTAAAEER